MASFELETKPGRKQFIFDNEDDFQLLRWHISKLYVQIMDYLQDNPVAKVLEVGPEDDSLIKSFCQENSISYKSLDIIPGRADYTASVEDLSVLNEKFDVIILLSVLEHVRHLHKTPDSLFNALNEKGKVFINTPFMFKVHGPEPDCWRISAYGYEALFEEKFDLEMESYPENQLRKNSIALSLNVVLTKKDLL
jgi:hypothetical protein